jgi:hypothetical protein
MEKSNDPIKRKLYQALNVAISPAEFEAWLQVNANILKTALNPNLYSDLFSLDYHQSECLSQLKSKILPYLDINECNEWKAKELLKAIINNEIDFIFGLRQFRSLFIETGFTFIPEKLVLYYESELDDMPIPDEYKLWDSDALQKKLSRLDSYKAAFIEDANIFLDGLK